MGDTEVQFIEIYHSPLAIQYPPSQTVV